MRRISAVTYLLDLRTNGFQPMHVGEMLARAITCSFSVWRNRDAHKSERIETSEPRSELRNARVQLKTRPTELRHRKMSLEDQRYIVEKESPESHGI